MTMKSLKESQKEESLKKHVSSMRMTTKSLNQVIFPDNKWIKKWDVLVLWCLLAISFILPYMLGVSGGFGMLMNVWWFVINVLINAVFFTDTFLYFFRAYRDKNGLLVFQPKRIRRNYLKTWFVPNFLSVLPFTIVFYVLGRKIIEESAETGRDESSGNNTFVLLRVMELLKLIRLARVPIILGNSDAVTQFRQTGNSQMKQFWKYVFLIVVVSHWFACIWCFVVFMEVLTFSAEKLQEVPNWIGYWYGNNYVPGGLNPLGWNNALDRYVLSLFWAAQTITSIGYGNIVPVTRAEWWVASALQLCAGMMWSYVIGGLVGVAAGMNVRDEVYRTRNDQASRLIQAFSETAQVEEDPHQAMIQCDDVGKRVRKYIHMQYKQSHFDAFATSLSEISPVLDTLSPPLQRTSVLLLARDKLETVPYLSSKYLSTDEQCEVALQTVILEFGTGDDMRIHEGVGDLGRGIIVMISGCAFAWPTREPKGIKNCSLLGSKITFDNGKVLVSSSSCAAEGVVKFLTFSKVLFIPRTAIMDVLKKNERAWKDSARWIYLKTLILHSKYVRPQKSTSFECEA